MKSSSAKRKLEAAYFDMLKNTHYSKITVTDIIRIANISRTTFYRHYTDIFDMHQKIADKLAFSIIDECIKAIVFSSGEEDYFEEILKIFNTQEKYIMLLSGENGSRYFFEALVRKSYEHIVHSRIPFNEEQLFRLRFMTIAMVGVYVRDILDNREHNPDYVEICKKLLNLDEIMGEYHG